MNSDVHRDISKRNRDQVIYLMHHQPVIMLTQVFEQSSLFTNLRNDTSFLTFLSRATLSIFCLPRTTFSICYLSRFEIQCFTLNVSGYSTYQQTTAPPIGS